jgi:hypothetical protein
MRAFLAEIPVGQAIRGFSGRQEYPPFQGERGSLETVPSGSRNTDAFAAGTCDVLKHDDGAGRNSAGAHRTHDRCKRARRTSNGTALKSPRKSMTSMRGKRAVENNLDVFDLPILLGVRVREKWPELRRRPRSRRIRWHRLVIDQPGLDLLLLLAQQAATNEGAQVTPQRPGGRPRPRPPRASRVRPRISNITDGSNHNLNMADRFLLSIKLSGIH